MQPRRCGKNVASMVVVLVTALLGCSAPAAVAGDRLPRILGQLQSLPSPAGPQSSEPRLSAGPDGQVVMSWLEARQESGHRLRWASLRDGRWSKPGTVVEGDSFFVNWADFPSVRPVGRHGLVAHWLWRSGPDTYAYDVRLCRSNDGGRTWTRIVTPHHDSTQAEHGFASLASSDAGVHAVWLNGQHFVGYAESQGPGPDMTLHAAVLDAAGVTQNEEELDARACDCCQTAAVATTRGLLVAYRDRSPDEVRDISLVRFEGGRWTEPYPLHPDGWKIAGCPVNGPAMDAAADHVAVVWFTAAADTPRVLVAFSDDGGQRFALPVRADGGNPIGRVGITLLPDGSSLVSWLESGAKEARIMARQVAADGELGALTPITRTSAARASGVPQVARARQEVIFAWTETSSGPRIRVARARLVAH